jgi:putative flippase GtrA
MLKHFVTLQFILFLFVGTTSAFLNWLARFFLNFWLSFPLAVMIAYGIGLTCAFILNRLLVFKYVNRPMANQIRDFVLVNLAFFPVVVFSALIMNRILQLWVFSFNTENIAHAMALAMPMIFTFLIYKFFTFRSK